MPSAKKDFYTEADIIEHNTKGDKMKTLKDIKEDRVLISMIRWDLKPRERLNRSKVESEEQMKVISKQLKDRVGFFFYIEVINGFLVVFLYENYPDGSGRYIAEITDAPEDMLIEAIEEAGGSREQDGRYPINSKVRVWLEQQLSV